MGAYGWLFSESTGRILFTSSAADAAAVEQALGTHGLLRLGVVGARGPSEALTVSYGDTEVLRRTVGDLRDHYRCEA